MHLEAWTLRVDDTMSVDSEGGVTQQVARNVGKILGRLLTRQWIMKTSILEICCIHSGKICSSKSSSHQFSCTSLSSWYCSTNATLWLVSLSRTDSSFSAILSGQCCTEASMILKVSISSNYVFTHIDRLFGVKPFFPRYSRVSLRTRRNNLSRRVGFIDQYVMGDYFLFSFLVTRITFLELDFSVLNYWEYDSAIVSLHFSNISEHGCWCISWTGDSCVIEVYRKCTLSQMITLFSFMIIGTIKKWI